MTRDDARALLSTIPGRKSSRSQGANACVAVASLRDLGWVGVQDTKRHGDMIVVPAKAFGRFVESLRPAEPTE